MKAIFNFNSLQLMRMTISIVLCGTVFAITSGCVKGYTNETMQPLAATASDLARAVMKFAKENPVEASLIDDQELVRRATAYDPKMLEPYKGLVVRGTADGLILVCTEDGKVSLFEDAECSDKVDKLSWAKVNAPLPVFPEGRCHLSLKENQDRIFLSSA